MIRADTPNDRAAAATIKYWQHCRIAPLCRGLTATGCELDTALYE